jgi:peptidoglycan/LPS O-acetylase OafA/YrhL
MRSLLVGLIAAAALYWIGAVFGLNGDQWNWWRSAAFAGAGLCVVASLVRSKIATLLNPERNAAAIATGGLAGMLLLALSITVMANRYSDPYSGPLFWPHTLALLGLLGLALVVVSVAALSGRPPRTQLRRKSRRNPKHAGPPAPGG